MYVPMPVNRPSLVRQLSLKMWHKTSGCARPNDHPKDIAVGDVVSTVSNEVAPFVANAIIATISGTCIHLSVFVDRSVRSVSGTTDVGRRDPAHVLQCR